MADLKKYSGSAVKTVTGSLAGSASLFAFNLVAAAYLSLKDYGDLVAALAHVNLGVTLAAFGFSSFCSKYYAERRDDFIVSRVPLLQYLTLTTAVGGVTIALIGHFGVPSVAVRDLVIPLSLLVVGYSAAEAGASFAQIHGRFYGVAAWLASIGVLRLVWLLVFFLFSGTLHLTDVKSALLLAAISSAFAFGSTLISLVSRSNPPNDATVGCRMPVTEIFRGAAPFGFANAAYLFYSQAPVLVLAQHGNSTDVATYGLAMMFVSSAYLLPSLMLQRVMIIDVVSLIQSDLVGAKELLIKYLRIALVAGLVFLVIGYGATAIYQYLFPAGKFNQVPVLLFILLLSLPVKFLEAVISAFLTARSGIHFKNLAVVGVIVLQIPVLLILTERFGGVGVAYGFLFTELVMLSAYAYLLLRRVLV
jgi:O-antigen/teichoic acid export membrane protein